MTLSNTATPIYYGLFRDAVLRGEIPVCHEISAQMERIDDRIANPNFYYDDEAVEGFVRYCEAELTLTDGSPLHLLDTFKLWAEDLLGWYYFDTKQDYIPSDDNHGGKWVDIIVLKRLTVKQYLIVARGAAKSLYESCLQSYFLNIDPSRTHQITTAPTMKQAEQIMDPIRTSINRARGPLFKFLTMGSIQNTTGNRALRQKLVATKKGVENFVNGSLLEVRPMSIDKLQGLGTKVNTVDEWLSGDLREDVIGALEQGASKVFDYVIIAVSSEGTVRNGPGDDIKLELARILQGEYYAPHYSIWHYKLDDVKEVGNPDMWPKAQPNIGKTVDWSVYHLEVEKAEKNPASRNDILAKRFGIPMEGYSFFFAHSETLLHRPHTFWRMRCSLGVDLSMGDDFCAFTFLFPLAREQFGVKTRSYISERTLHALQPSRREKYEEFIAEGSLRIFEGNLLDMDLVYADLQEHIDAMEYEVEAVGYDPYNSKEFLELWKTNNSLYGVDKVIQGAKTESVPLGELKKLAADRCLIFDQEIMKWTMGNAITMEDTNGNRKLMKQRHDEKVDNVSALMDAWVAYKKNKEAFE